MYPPVYSRRHLRAAFIVLWLASLVAITVGSLLPSAVDGVGSDKLMHLGAYGVLSGLTWPALEVWGGRRLLGVALALIVFGLAIELVQPSVGREFSVADAVANALGVLVGIPLGRLIRVTLRLAVPPNA